MIVLPGLQITEMTLREHNDYLVWLLGQKPLTREEAKTAAHREDEIEAWFAVTA